MKRIIVGLVCGATLLLTLAACGGGEASPVDQAEEAVLAYDVLDLGDEFNTEYDHATCEEAGFMVFVGEREKVWDCTYAYEGDEDFRDCFVVIDGEAQDVTADLIYSDDVWGCVEALG